MATWSSLEIGNGLVANKTLQRIMDAFMPKHIGAGRPIAMAIFTSINKSNKNITLYFSPAAASLAMQFGASPYQADFVDMDLSLLVGDERSMEQLFPSNS